MKTFRHKKCSLRGAALYNCILSFQIQSFRHHMPDKVFLLRISLLAICLHLFCSLPALYAQKRGKKPDTIYYKATPDSATISKNLNKLAKDTGNVAGVKKSDTTVAVLISRIEHYTLLMNQLMSTLKRGFDTSGISDALPLADSSLNMIKSNIARQGSTPNINDVYTNKVMLQQLSNVLEFWQNRLFGYYDKLVYISDTMATLRSDTSMRNLPAEDELYGFYVGQLTSLIRKYHSVDSANRRNLIQIGLLQNRVANRYIEVSTLQEDMDYQLSQFGPRMLRKDYNYLWERQDSLKRSRDFLKVFGDSVEKNMKVLGIFFMFQWPIFIVWTLCALLFGWWVFHNIRRIRQHHASTEADAILLHSRFLYRFPIACTMVVVASLSAFLSIRYPTLYTEFTLLTITAALCYIMRSYLPAAFYKYWLALSGLLVLYCVNNLLIEATDAEQWALFLGGGCCVALGIKILKSSRHTTFVQPKYTRFILLLFIVTSALSMLLALTGRITAAKILGSSAVVNTVMAMDLYILIAILMEAIYLQVEANKNSSTFISFMDYQNIQSRLKTFFAVAATVGWLVLIIRNLYVYDLIYEGISTFLTTPRHVGSTAFTFSSIIIFLIVLWFAVFMTQLIAYFFGNTGNHGTPIKKTKWGSAMLLIRLAVLGGGLLLAFAASGIPMDKLAIVIGALGVGIGFGLQNIVNNLVSGIILAFEKPIEVGDVIELGTRSGVVKEIGIRSSKISAYDGSEVIVPNGDLISQQLINWTLSNRTRRVEILIGVAYGSDVNQVMGILRAAIGQREGVLEVPEPVVMLYRFGNSSIDFRVLFWISDLGNAGTLQSDVMTAMYNQLNEAGIELPFPQADLHVRSVDPEIIKQWNRNMPQDPPAS